MSKAIINIHGRSNKPDENTLVDWWKRSVEEGLEHSTTSTLGSTAFKMAYYADIYYVDEGPIPNNQNPEPYKAAEKGSLQSYKKSMVDRLRNVAGNWLDEPLDWLEEQSSIFSKLARKVAKKQLKDIGEYYSNNEIRNKVNKRLMDLLLAHQHDEIILISHSMGTIVAYDVLREIGRSENHFGVKVEHLITMGAPLGLTVVKGNVINYNGKLRTPTCVTGSWVNFSDPQDVVCLDSHLADDYEANSSGIKVEDKMVCNDYPGNEHKSYGYLRTPEFSNHLASLL